jgi:3-oxoacid CoA-transferase subunit A
MERSLKADFALLRANVADTLGNTTYRGTSQNFNGVMATAANVTIIEVDEIVEPGGLDSAVIHTPALYVNRMVKIS